MKTLFKILLVIVLAASLAGCAKSTLEKTDSGLILHLPDGGKGSPVLVRAEVVSDDIVRISATAEAKFPERESMVVLPSEGPTTKFEISETDETVALSTARLRVHIDRESGEVAFQNEAGEAILTEKAGGGKTFSPIEVDGYKGWSFRQVFESPDDEAFFGLGQHQSDEWNYKGRNEVLYQYNTKISVPFIASNRNYGIMWDNYSLTKFGTVEDYEQISQFRLFDKDGQEGGLTATYTTAEGENYTIRSESEIAYEHLSDVSAFPEGFPFWQSTISWEGELEAPETGEYEFKLYYAGYTTVHMDGREVVAERWRTAWNPNTYKFRVKLKAGERIPVRLNWKPDGGVSYIGLKALGPLDPVEQGRLSLWSEMGQELDYYFILGDNMDEVISGYRELTGKAPIMPQWAYGFWQSRERYKTQEEILGALKEFRKRKIPIDNIVQDWSYWEEDQWGSHEFDPERFPDPAQMIKDIHDMNAKVMISVWPKFYVGTEHYNELNEKGWMYPVAVKDSIRDWIAHGYIGSFYDAYDPGARELFWEQMNEHLYSLGIDAWWMDASEPDILSNAHLEYRKELSNPTALGPSTEYLNTYSLVNADAIYNGQLSVDPDKRVFLLTRSGFLGLQRYSTASWSGDIGTTWEDMKAQISAGLNFALSGIPYWTMDIGGFCVERRYEQAPEGSEDLEEWRELNTRWAQFGTFAPLFRTHGQFPFREVYNLAPDSHPAYQSIVRYNRMRYRLMPYIYSLAGKVWYDDYTLMRALVMDFPNDPEVTGISDQYMFGPNLMICPVYSYKARSREVHFPAGTSWFDLHKGKVIEGGQTLNVDAPYEDMPMYVRAGSIVPTGPEIQYVGEKKEEPLTLFVYGGANGSFTLYEDDGCDNSYLEGKWTKIPMSYDAAENTLTIGAREGSYPGMQENRTFRVIFIDPSDPGPMEFDQAADSEVEYRGEAISLSL